MTIKSYRNKDKCRGFVNHFFHNINSRLSRGGQKTAPDVTKVFLGALGGEDDVKDAKTTTRRCQSATFDREMFNIIIYQLFTQPVEDHHNVVMELLFREPLFTLQSSAINQGDTDIPFVVAFACIPPLPPPPPPPHSDKTRRRQREVKPVVVLRRVNASINSS